MKKKLFSILFLIVMTNVSIEAQDTSFVYRQHTYQISESDGSIKVIVNSSKKENQIRVYETHYSEDGHHIAWELLESVSFPLSGLIKENKEKYTKKYKFDPHWAGIGFGFCNAVDNRLKNIISSNGFDIDFSSSYEIFWNILNFSFPLPGNHWGIVSGIGLDWRNYELNNNHYFSKQNHQIQVKELPDNSNLKVSRIKTVDLTIPILLEWQTLQKTRFFVSGGAVVGFKTYSSLKTEYLNNRTNYDEFSKNIGPNPVNVDILLQAGFGCIGFYAKYSLFNTFQEGYAPPMHSLSSGIMLVF